MNVDHPEDNLLIVRAFGRPDATASTMTGVNENGGVWKVTDPSGEHEHVVAWPSGQISERPEIRREVVLLYKAACEALGVSPREEHEPASDHPRGKHGAVEPEDEDKGGKPFSTVIRESSWSDHSDSERATFMEDIMKGRGTKQDYTDLVAQHFFMYEALEAAADSVLGDPAFEGFHVPALVRLPSLEADLRYLMGDDWRDRITPTPATAAYVARIREVSEARWVAGIVAHHYTRYLGDLSGGQMIAKRVAKQHELSGEGVAFYDFAELGSIPAFKDDYRAALDRLGASLSTAERADMLEEVRTAYGFNTAVFVDLGKRKAAAV
ncbi:DUF2470 domain-containing protein [Leucobacter insecticola]|uniref:DUF2470 domain-containing protein n=2 Tax=Leucobacter insecticola TaxID=2714934 RepID=A0A6G8FME6_9MICO|nr:DUF2470 domain-containing protein [Leucobacter insecticola]